MKYFILLVVFITTFFMAKGQVTQLYYDQNHFQIVSLNYTWRITGERILQSQSERINKDIEGINTNLAKVVLAKDMMYKYLTEVNEVLKDGRQMKYIISLVDDIVREASLAVQDVADAPQYSLVTLRAVESIKLQSLGIFSEITRLINKGGVEAMMDNATRDEILTEITMRLRIMRGALFGIRNSIKWAKLRGLWNTLNPFRAWINQDRLIINRIVRDYNYITR